MKCTFCDKLCLAENHLGNSKNKYYGNWICHNHPALIVFDSGKLGRHSIYAFHGKHWYEFSYNQIHKYYVLYCIDDYTEIDYETGESEQRVNRVMVNDVPTFENITPENAQSKLNMILVFS